MSATALPRAVHERPGSEDRAGVRTDIQGLRALAVSLVVVYHVFPHSFLSGGFVGVDVFFVISGFLITLHLMQKPPSRGRDLATFWGRRVRRLLPASLLVLTTTLVASRLFAPDTQWANTARQARGGGAVRRQLAAGPRLRRLPRRRRRPQPRAALLVAVGGGAVLLRLADPDPGHGACVARRRRLEPGPHRARRARASLVVLSLGYSVYETATNPAAAYFVTPTRMWELGIGGLLAVVVAVRQRRGLPPLLPETARSVLAWAGLAAIAWTAVTYSGATPFPGLAGAAARRRAPPS